MNHSEPEAKGRADFLAGHKDPVLYHGTLREHAAYRAGWQNARRDAELDRLGVKSLRDVAPPAPTQAVSASSPSEAPPWGFQAPPRPQDGGETVATPKPKKPKPAEDTAQLDLFA